MFTEVPSKSATTMTVAGLRMGARWFSRHTVARRDNLRRYPYPATDHRQSVSEVEAWTGDEGTTALCSCGAIPGSHIGGLIAWVTVVTTHPGEVDLASC